MAGDVPLVGTKAGSRVDQGLHDDLATCLGAGMTVSDAIKMGVCALAMRIKKQQRLSHKEESDVRR